MFRPWVARCPSSAGELLRFVLRHLSGRKHIEMGQTAYDTVSDGDTMNFLKSKHKFTDFIAT